MNRIYLWGNCLKCKGRGYIKKIKGEKVCSKCHGGGVIRSEYFFVRDDLFNKK